MIIYNLKFAIRNVIKNKGYNLINILGLSIGMMASIFICLWIVDELSYDRFHQFADRIYRVAWQSENPQTRTPHPMSYQLVNDMPEVENAVSITPVWGDGLTRPMRTVKQGEIQYEENGIYAADTTFFQVFSFPLLKGDPNTALKDVGGLVITQAIARKYFEDEDPMGKMLIINFGTDIPFVITGVMEQIPENSHFHFDFLISYNTTKSVETGEFYEWSDFGHYNYLLMSENASPKDLESRLVEWMGQYREWSEEALTEFQNGTIGFKLQPLTDIHLRSNIRWELENNGNIVYVYIFSSLAFFIILIACINFMNLSTAGASKRSVEIGLRKAIGAKRTQLISQFYSESFLASLLAMIIGIVIFEFFTPVLNSLTGKVFNLNYADPLTLILLFIFVIICTLLAGTYPAIILSGFKPTQILKTINPGSRDKVSFRNILVIFQFAISAFLIIGTLIISSQIKFLRNQKLGLMSEQVLAIPIRDTLIQTNYKSVKTEFLKNNGVLNVSAVSNIPGKNFNQNPIQWKGDDETLNVSELSVDHDFFATLGIPVTSGRSFSLDRESDEEFAYILNKEAASFFDWDSPIEQEVTWYDDEITRDGKVIGVVENFHFQSLHKAIEPLIIHLQPDVFNYFLIKISPVNITESITYLKNTYQELDPNNDFTYFFLDDEFANLYQSEERIETIFSYFTLLSIFISCLGLFGLSAYDAERRTKEIGIRKVNGATMANIVILLSRDISRWVFIAFVIACPFGFFLMRGWLKNFAYQISISWWSFILTGIIVILIGLIAVSYQAVRAARRNPIETLRYE
jgi:putative ABC transport system permease protein